MGDTKHAIDVEIPARMDAVYDMISDHAALSGLTPYIESVKVKSRRPERYLAEETLVLGGRRHLCMVRHHCSRPRTHEYFVVGGDAKGSRITETYQATPTGTRITVSIDWRGGLRGMLGSGPIRDDYADMLRASASGLHASRGMDDIV